MSSCPAISVAESSATVPQSRRFTNRSALTKAVIIRRGRAWLKELKRVALAVVSSVWVLLACKAVIACVAAFDTYLTIKYAQSLDVYEQNPLGRWLMGLDHGPICETQQIAAFITAKFLGTVVVLITIQGLAYWRVRLAGMVAMPVTAAQLYLLAFLMLGNG